MILSFWTGLVFLAGWAPLLPAAIPARADETNELESLFRDAEEAAAAGDPDGAVALLREARDLALDGNLPLAEVSLRLGRLLYWTAWPPQQVYLYQEGLDHLYQAVQEDPADQEIALTLVDALLEERDALFAERQLQSAESALQRARDTLDPWLPEGGIEVRRRLARALMRTYGEEVRGYELCRELLQENPLETARHEDFVQAASRARRHQQALVDYEAMPTEPALRAWYSAQVHVARANQTYNWQRDDELALSDYLAAEKLVLQAAEEDSALVETAAIRASDYRTWAGWTLVRLERLPAASDAFVNALKRTPDNPSAIDGLAYVGNLFRQAGDLESAREIARKACDLVPDRADLWHRHASICRETGDAEESLRAYRQAMALDPDDARALHGAARILVEFLEREPEQAERWLLDARTKSREFWETAVEDAVRQDQLLVYGDSLVSLWRLYDGRGDMRRASEMVNELRDIDPSRKELPPLPADPILVEGESPDATFGGSG